jgi:hypothetical protein
MPSIQVPDHHNQFSLFKGIARMLSNKTRHTVHQDHAKSMDGAALLWLFLTARIFAVGALRQIYAHHNHFVMESCKPGLSHPNPQTKSVRHTTTTAWRRISLARWLQKAVLCI